ncbi:hypothetical protein TWF788_006907 [Orbilia oligospora]|uniref:Uncharacterized protein n=1 Tax=Orbilia oligospora TaxID=2813651 RepID=A0A7C8U616_ORBOL|nr:hypothetical protein TWF788_006907 [Orbilia oligospora]
MIWNPFGGSSSDKDSTVSKTAPPPPAPIAPTIPSSIPPSPPTFPNDQQQLPQLPVQLTEKQKYMKDMGYKTAIAAAIICPVIIFMPPRKMDFYTFGLICTTAYCVNHVMNEHGHPGLLYAIAPKGSMDYQEKVAHSRKKYDNMMPSEAIWAQLKDVWNQRYDDDDEEEVEEQKESMLDQIRREQAEKGDSSILRMLEEQEKKRK